jgi:hypothetical protein
MDETMNRLARELADAIAAVVSSSPQVEACRERARAAGFDLQVSLEAVVGFAPRVAADGKTRPARKTPEMTQNDKRFLRSLRIAPDEPAEPVERDRS